MNAKRYFSYVRVSTARQGQTGTSLAEQLSAIERYSKKWNLEIVRCFEEQETAAKAGRPVFLEMLRALRIGKADGVIIHKIDRGARNLKDWADLGAMIDSGIEVHFANEAIDLHSRGGRLSADIQAVVAADYIRNLREEVKKGFYGRLKQGFYPMPAPVGYRDAGAGKPKILDPAAAPFVRKAFELYATGKWSIYALTKKMDELGLRNKNGKPFIKNGIHKILKNRFYAGLIEIEKTGETFLGQHEPLITQSLFDLVQDTLAGKKKDRKQRHFFLFRRLIDCEECSYKTIAERQKGFVYYRCQTKSCAQKTVREEEVEKEFVRLLESLKFTERENRYLEEVLSREEKESSAFKESRKQTLNLRLVQCRSRLSNLTDAFIDGSIEREIFVEKKSQFLVEEQRLKEELVKLDDPNDEALIKTRKILEQANQAYSSYKQAIAEEKREMVQILASNLSVRGKTVTFKLNYPFEVIRNRSLGADGGPLRDVPRTDFAHISQLIRNLYKFYSAGNVYQN